MGIAQLKRHLQPYGSSVWIGTPEDAPNDNARRITSVVIDGPSLVYHVYHCLLTGMDVQFNPVDAQPSSNEVSIGVMQFLLHLRAVNVTVKKICFDGALPLAKRPTRLERLESSRRKLENLGLSKRGFSKSSMRRDAVKIGDARVVFGGRHSAIVSREAPADPFMVAAVIEDLKHRWSWGRIAEYASDSKSHLGLPLNGFPWADLANVEPGEADIYAAEAARLTNSSVLTGDSDLLVHDLGPEGSVIFLDSLETMQPESVGDLFTIRASELRPDVISKKFGITDLRRLGFELKHSPSTSISTLVQRCKDYSSDEVHSDLYRSFLKEYEAPGRRHATQIEGVILDPRITELCLQYEISELRTDLEPPHVYLPFLIENCERRCAWTEGIWIRALGYSFLDMTFSSVNASRRVVEYMRRGSRICPTIVDLLDRNDIEAYTEYLLQTLNQVLPHKSDTSIHWKMFALAEIWRPSESVNSPRLERGNIRQFLDEGCTGSRLSWNDIHLGAQVQAVLYSLKLLKDLALAALPALKGGRRTLVARIVDSLSSLPPLHILSASRSSFQREIEPRGDIDSAVDTLFSLLSQYCQDDISDDGQIPPDTPRPKDAERHDPTMGNQEFRIVQSRSKRKRNARGKESGQVQKQQKSTNPYELLGDGS